MYVYIRYVFPFTSCIPNVFAFLLIVCNQLHLLRSPKKRNAFLPNACIRKLSVSSTPFVQKYLSYRSNESMSTQKCIPVPSPLPQSKQLLFIRFFYIFCDFFMMEGYIISELILRFISLQRGHIIIFAIQRILRMTESHIFKN